MAKEKVEDIGRGDSLKNIYLGLFENVMEGTVSMQAVEGTLRAYLMRQPEDERESIKQRMGELARRQQQVAEGFLQALTVVGSRQ